MENRARLRRLPLRLVSAMLAICLLLTGAAAPAESRPKTTAASRFRVKSAAGGLKIVKLLKKETALSVPAQIGGLPVVEIGPSAFAGNAKLLRADLPGTVRSVGKRAFANCKKLEAVYLREGVERIGKSAFAGCKKLRALVLPGSLTEMDASAFSAGMELTLYGKPGSFAEQYVLRYKGPAKLRFCAGASALSIAIEGFNTLAVGETGALRAVRMPEGSAAGATLWSSDRPDIASVDARTGLVTGRSAGRALITAKADGLSASHEMRVIPGDSFESESIDRIFSEPSNRGPIGRLAKLSIAMADSVYDKGEALKSFKMLGFGKVSAYNYPDPQADHGVAFMLAERPLLTDGKRCTLYAAVVRGTLNTGREWLSNAELGSGDNHLGFATAGDEVYEKLLERIGDADPDSVKIWVTGFSRGAAVTNYVSKRLWDAGYDGGNLYGYAFACPGLARKPDKSVSVYNYNIDDDFVPKLPPAGWNYGRNGTSYLLKGGTEVYARMKLVYKKLTKQNYTALSGAQSDQIANFVFSTLSAEKFRGAMGYLRRRAPKETARVIEELMKGLSVDLFLSIGKLIWKLNFGIPEESREERYSDLADWLGQLLALLKTLYNSGGKLMNAHDGLVYNCWMTAQYGEG